MFTPHPAPDYRARFILDHVSLKYVHRGFCLNGRKRLSRKHSWRNVLIIGGTGTGKSATVGD
ncbi:MAG: hypothetical protein R3B47_12065 [Bacteroidia bacterium]